MFTITSDTQLRIGFSLLKDAREGHWPKDPDEKILISIKKAVRKYVHRETNVISVYSGFDYVLTHEKIPHMFQTFEEAEEWFDEERRLPYYPSPYDCTGQMFTVQHKIFYSNKEFYLYHLARMDV